MGTQQVGPSQPLLALPDPRPRLHSDPPVLSPQLHFPERSLLDLQRGKDPLVSPLFLGRSDWLRVVMDGHSSQEAGTSLPKVVGFLARLPSASKHISAAGFAGSRRRLLKGKSSLDMDLPFLHQLKKLNKNKLLFLLLRLVGMATEGLTPALRVEVGLHQRREAERGNWRDTEWPEACPVTPHTHTYQKSPLPTCPSSRASLMT